MYSPIQEGKTNQDLLEQEVVSSSGIFSINYFYGYGLFTDKVDVTEG